MTGEPRKDDNVTPSPASESKVKSGAGSPSRRAVGIVRVSRVGSRSGEQFVSPSEQRTRIEEACARDKLALVDVLEELDVSGGAALEKRPGLRRAVEMVEVGEAEVIVAGYFDRLVRSLAVQAEVVSRVEKAGGAILAVDVGAVTGASAGQWLSGTMLGAVSEYHRRVTAERTQDAKRRAIARGVPTFAKIPPGYQRRTDGTLETNRDADTIRQAFELRANGATVMNVREFLREHGLKRSFHGTTAILASRIYLGELRFGAIVNQESHAPIVTPELFAKVQRMRSTRGRRPKSERLLARQGVLRCASCGARMVVGTTRQQGKPYSFYRCNPGSDCPHRVTISADLAEQVIWNATVELLREVEGSASAGDRVEAARAVLGQAEAALQGAVETLEGFEDIPATRQKLATLREARDAALETFKQAEAASGPALRVRADDERLTLDEKRALIRAVVAEARVSPGRGADRIRVVAA